jgi:hypothetical protein
VLEDQGRVANGVFIKKLDAVLGAAVGDRMRYHFEKILTVALDRTIEPMLA